MGPAKRRKLSREEDFEVLLCEEGLLMDIRELLLEDMEGAKLSKAGVAERLGKSRPFVTKIFREGHNPTLRTVADLFWAVGRKLHVTSVPLEEQTEVRSSSGSLMIRYAAALAMHRHDTSQQLAPPPFSTAGASGDGLNR